MRIQHQSQHTAGLLSGQIWAGIPYDEILLGTRPGCFYFDHFTNCPTLATTVVAGGLYAYIDSGGPTIKQAVDFPAGALEIAGNDAQDEEVCVRPAGGVAGGCVAISDTAGANYLTAWEARIRFGGSIAAHSFFIGLCEEYTPANTFLADDGTGVASKDKVGYQILEADPDGLDAVHNDATGDIIVKDVAQLIVVDTWYQIGCRFDGFKTRWYIDGAQVGAGVLPAATDFPDGEELHLIFGSKTHDTNATNFEMDFWAVGSLFEAQ